MRPILKPIISNSLSVVNFMKKNLIVYPGKYLQASPTFVGKAGYLTQYNDLMVSI
jgi:hypothetical protein